MNAEVELFTTSILGNPRTRARHDRYITVLTAAKVPFVYHDLASDEEAKKRWRRKARDFLLPGLLVHNEWRGTYDEFDEAVEYGELHDFLRLDPTRSTALPAPAPAAVADAPAQRSDTRLPPAPTLQATPAAPGHGAREDRDDVLESLLPQGAKISDADVDALFKELEKPLPRTARRTFAPPARTQPPALPTPAAPRKSGDAAMPRYDPSARNLVEEAARAIGVDPKPSANLPRMALRRAPLHQVLEERRRRQAETEDRRRNEELFASLGLTNATVSDADADALLSDGIGADRSAHTPSPEGAGDRANPLSQETGAALTSLDEAPNAASLHVMDFVTSATPEATEPVESVLERAAAPGAMAHDETVQERAMALEVTEPAGPVPEHFADAFGQDVEPGAPVLSAADVAGETDGDGGAKSPVLEPEHADGQKVESRATDGLAVHEPAKGDYVEAGEDAVTRVREEALPAGAEGEGVGVEGVEGAVATADDVQNPGQEGDLPPVNAVRECAEAAGRGPAEDVFQERTEEDRAGTALVDATVGPRGNAAPASARGADGELAEQPETEELAEPLSARQATGDDLQASTVEVVSAEHGAGEGPADDAAPEPSRDATLEPSKDAVLEPSAKAARESSGDASLGPSGDAAHAFIDGAAPEPRSPFSKWRSPVKKTQSLFGVQILFDTQVPLGTRSPAAEAVATLVEDTPTAADLGAPAAAENAVHADADGSEDEPSHVSPTHPAAAATPTATSPAQRPDSDALASEQAAAVPAEIRATEEKCLSTELEAAIQEDGEAAAVESAERIQAEEPLFPDESVHETSCGAVFDASQEDEDGERGTRSDAVKPRLTPVMEATEAPVSSSADSAPSPDTVPSPRAHPDKDTDAALHPRATGINDEMQAVSVGTELSGPSESRRADVEGADVERAGHSGTEIAEAVRTGSSGDASGGDGSPWGEEYRAGSDTGDASSKHPLFDEGGVRSMRPEASRPEEDGTQTASDSAPAGAPIPPPLSTADHALDGPSPPNAAPPSAPHMPPTTDTSP
ncbi:hypothetical protein MSPP1_002062 [Malassezia sp. CBS 17886]|nr:hypothetical protein MSPP1_002062 [Malassezia sp. CBS 17886]